MPVHLYAAGAKPVWAGGTHPASSRGRSTSSLDDPAAIASANSSVPPLGITFALAAMVPALISGIFFAASPKSESLGLRLAASAHGVSVTSLYAIGAILVATHTQQGTSLNAV